MKSIVTVFLIYMSIVAFVLFLHTPGLRAQGGHSIVLTWSNPTTGTPPTSVDVFRGTSAGGESTTALANVPSPGATFSDTTGVAGTTYFYVVKEKNQFGSAPASNEVSALFLGDAPGAATGLSATGH